MMVGGRGLRGINEERQQDHQKVCEGINEEWLHRKSGLSKVVKSLRRHKRKIAIEMVYIKSK
ncbi:hypothetical protein DVR12_00480 [Chitinophaga silvatica]|uniref:Uncharacterized protein n=1 Tax=Chitinophaga silvatica TaxID=2282649 RepID=A0A3E1YFX9_9BACT|nr:hypothetical protein DVR12_00480 [Chitinophaga silvatica]